MAKPKNIIPVSPSVQQRAHMRAPEYLPLILEPLSRLYTDSLIVLDFQSLYPSVIIAYNYCFSTCLGRIEHLGNSADPFEFGASQLRLPAKLLRQLVERDLVTVSPCGVAFVKAAVREGVLPRMLREILDTRLMVKQSMKLHRDDRRLQRVLHSRQLGLKLMANVTYGYTAANFSGRMPCVEVSLQSFMFWLQKPNRENWSEFAGWRQRCQQRTRNPGTCHCHGGGQCQTLAFARHLR